MNSGRSRLAPAVGEAIETLEGRLLLSAIAPDFASSRALRQSAVEVSARTARAARTETRLTANAGTLGQPITFTVTVRAAAAAGSPEGTVDITYRGAVIETLTLSPTTSASARYAFSDATGTLTPQPGGSAYFFGKHPVSAVFIPTGGLLKSKARATFDVSKPIYTALAGGVEISTIKAGSGPQIQTGQTAGLLYTGYLAKTGHIFDASDLHSEPILNVTLGAGEVIPGFDEGTVGMQVGETRIVLIPPAEGYGAMGLPPAIPRNSTLIFVITLESIS